MAIEVIKLSKAYGENIVLDKFSCTIEEGAATCIMGPSGSGKTTLLRILMGLEQPDSGNVTSIQGMRKSAVFQEERLCENLSVMSNIRLACGSYHTINDLRHAISAVGLPPDCISQPVRELSGGMRRRVEILRALLSEYDVLFLDEPFKALDSETKQIVINYIRSQSQGKTVVLVTHDITECEAMGAHHIISTLPQPSYP